jgi:dTDP-glucose pyrophosphorylase
MDKAVILAAGRGTRMQRVQDSAGLSAAQSEFARAGLKAMMPVGRPFIDYVLSGLADVGYRRVCLVIGPDHSALREHVGAFNGGRLKIEFAIQQEPLGTLTGSAVAAFRPEALCRGNIAAERLRNFAILSVSKEGYLQRVIEKPTDDLFSRDKESALISMNCWRFTPAIFAACRAIPRSSRNEYELTDAVSYAIEKMGEQFELLIVDDPVLDLSTQADIGEVARRLASVEVRL